MRRCLTLAALAMGTAAPALAQEWKVDASLSLVGSAVEDETPLAPAADGLLAAGSLVVSRSDILDNGLTLAWRGEVRIDRDAATRPSFAGVLGDCPAASALCPRVVSGAFFRSPVSPATGLAADGALADEDVFAALEGASVSLSGAWGEGILGFDSGAAARLDARPPTVLQRVSASSPRLDPTGLVVTRARNDVTGPSAKITYMTPRWIGFRLGASYTPRADQRGADFDPGFSEPGLAKAELENVWEGAASFARRSPETGLRIRAAVTYTTATAANFITAFGDYAAWGAGLELEQNEWIGGVRWLSSNNAWNAGNADYQAWEAGLVRQGSEWRIGIEGGWARDRLTGIEGASWLVGASKKLNEHVDLGIAWSSTQADLPVLMLPGVGHTNARNDGLVLELTVRN